MVHVSSFIPAGALLAVVSALQPVDINERLNQLGLAETTEGESELAFVPVPQNYPYMIAGLRLGKYLHDERMKKELLHDFSIKPQAENPDANPEVWQLWGHACPMLRAVSLVTDCHLADTPPSYWPEMFAERYFGSKVSFAVLHDPYTRVVDFFKENLHLFPMESEICDIDTVVSKMLGRWIAGERFEYDCALTPQSYYVEGKYGAKLLIDARNMTNSLEKVMKKHSYEYNRDAFAHVLARRQQDTGAHCQQLWAGSLNHDSKKLIKYVYEDDFKLLCDNFGYCDSDEMPCFDTVSGACQSQ